MRIAVGSLMQETNTFAPTPTTIAMFEAGYLWRGDALLGAFRAVRVEMGGFLQVLAEAQATIVPLLAAHAYSGGPLTRATFDALVGELLDQIRAALPLDGVLLALHGAMVVEDDGDAEGALLHAVRELVGQHVPIAASLDLHGHITPRMLETATLLVGYQEYPHIDMFETGQRTAALLLATLRGAIQPTMALAKRSLIVSPVNARTTDGPLHDLWQGARQAERNKRALAVSLFPVQPWLDVPDLGCAVLVLADGDPVGAVEVAEAFADEWWHKRAQFEPELADLDAAIRAALAAPQGTVVVGDAGDAPSSGSAADNAAVLRALLAAGADRATRPTYLTLRDAPAVAQCSTAGVGARIQLQVGHTLSQQDGVPLAIDAQVCALSDGTYTMMGPGATGSVMHMGPTAVVAIGAIRLLLKSLPSLEWDAAVYTSVGLDPHDAALIFVKSPSHFRVAYAPLATQLLVADTPGAARPNMRALHFERVTRPLYPLDP